MSSSALQSPIINEGSAMTTTTVTQKNQTISSQKGVSFSTVEIRKYNQILGDNPAVRYGPPIQLDWYYDEDETLIEDLDVFESQRFRERRRSLQQLAMSYYQRQNKLIHIWGYSLEEIRKAKREVKAIKRKRWMSDHRARVRVLRFDG